MAWSVGPEGSWGKALHDKLNKEASVDRILNITRHFNKAASVQ